MTLRDTNGDNVRELIDCARRGKRKRLTDEQFLALERASEGPHASLDDLVSYVLDELTSARQTEVESHLATCEACLDILTGLAEMRNLCEEIAALQALNPECKHPNLFTLVGHLAGNLSGENKTRIEEHLEDRKCALCRNLARSRILQRVAADLLQEQSLRRRSSRRARPCPAPSSNGVESLGAEEEPPRTVRGIAVGFRPLLSEAEASMKPFWLRAQSADRRLAVTLRERKRTVVLQAFLFSNAWARAVVMVEITGERGSIQRKIRLTRRVPGGGFGQVVLKMDVDALRAKVGAGVCVVALLESQREAPRWTRGRRRKGPAIPEWLERPWSGIAKQA